MPWQAPRRHGLLHPVFRGFFGFRRDTGSSFFLFSYAVPDVGIEPTDGFSVAERRKQGEGKDPVQPFPALWPFRRVCFFRSGQVFSFRHAAGRSLPMRVLSRSATRRSIKSSDVSYDSDAWMSWSDSDSSSP